MAHKENDVLKVDADLAPPRARRIGCSTYGEFRKKCPVREASDSLLLFDPINIRYACGFSNEQIFQCHTPSTYLFVPAEGSAILHYRSDRQSLLSLGTLCEVRDDFAYTCFAAGPTVE